MDLESLLGGASGLVSGYTSSVQGIFIWSIIAAILAITGAILSYFLFIYTFFCIFPLLFSDRLIRSPLFGFCGKSL